MKDGEMAELACMVYSGLGGVVMIFLLGVVTVAFFVSSYYYQRFCSKKEKRPPVVFYFDLLKMLTAGFISSAANYTFTAKVSWVANGVTVRGKSLEGIGWYGAISVVDVLVGAPLSIAVGRLINRTCKAVHKHLRNSSALKDTAHQNMVYAKYGDEHDCSCDYATAPRWCGGCGGTHRW